MATTNKQQEFSPYRIMWLIVSKEYIYIDATKKPRRLKFSDKTKRELLKRGFVLINGHLCRHNKDAFSAAIEREMAIALIRRYEKLSDRHCVRLFFITDKQFGMCYNSNFWSFATSSQKDSAVVF